MGMMRLGRKVRGRCLHETGMERGICMGMIAMGGEVLMNSKGAVVKMPC